MSGAMFQVQGLTGYLEGKAGLRRILRQVELTVEPGNGPVWLGVTGEDRAGKATLTQITAEGPADKAGLKEGDVVIAAENKEIRDYNQLVEAVREKETGDKISLKIRRGSETLEVAVTVEDRPGPAAPPPPSDVYMGIQGEDGPQGGARLTQITADGPAAKAGLEEGDVILWFPLPLWKRVRVRGSARIS